MRIVFDVETDGLLDAATKVHSLVVRDLDSGKVWSCADQPGWRPVREGLEIITNADEVWGHNVIGFDLPVLRKLYRLQVQGTVWDTLVSARMLWIDIADRDWRLVSKQQLDPRLVGSHSLKAWGQRLGIRKQDFGETTDWQEWSEEMQRYCEQDTVVTAALVSRILAHPGYNLVALGCEHELAEYLFAQEMNGFPFDVVQAVELQATLQTKLTEVEAGLRGAFTGWWKHTKPSTAKANRRMRVGDTMHTGSIAGAESCKLEWVEFSPSSRDHIAAALQRKYGWVPTKWTETGKPMVDEAVLRGLSYPEAPLLQAHFLVTKRLGQLATGNKAWLRMARPNRLTGLYHLHGGVNQSGAVTHRASHHDPNLAQVPSVKQHAEGVLWGYEGEYGAECRALFGVPPGWSLVGADASGLELRCLAHYMARYDEGEYGRILLTEDIHTANQLAAGLETRNQAKTFIYAFLYGAGDAKIGSIVQPEASEEKRARIGKKLRKKFLASLPALEQLVRAVQYAANRNGYLKLIDGRRAPVRSEHAALNTLLQGTGAVICKHWITEFQQRMTGEYGPQGWTHAWAACAWVHDEIQVAARAPIADAVAGIAVASIRAMTDKLGFRCPLDGEARVGRSWFDTH